jgi:hypothetical protein
MERSTHRSLRLKKIHTLEPRKIEIGQNLMKKWSMKEERWRSVLNAFGELLKRDYEFHPIM